MGLCLHFPGPSAISQDRAFDGNEPASLSVETLAERARSSVVVISHYGRDGKVAGVGSGFILSEDGLIATCQHVIGEARPIKVMLADDREFAVTEVYASDRKLDLAIVRIAADGLPALPLGDSDLLKQGSSVVAIGNPQGLDLSIVRGVVSAIREFDNSPMIQLAIPIEPGNSGGPLLDMSGRVHGLLTLKSALTDNLGFAMPVNALKLLLETPNPIPMDRWLTIGTLDRRLWEPVFGARWTQRGGQIRVEEPGDGFGGRALCLWRDPAPKAPFEAEVTVRLNDENGAAGLVFASDGEHRHYGFYPSSGQIRLTRFNGPSVFSWTILKQIQTSLYRPGDWNHLRVRVEKDSIVCFLNGEELARVPEMELDLEGSRVGLAKFRQTQAEFKHFRIGHDLSNGDFDPERVADLRRAISTLIQTESAGSRAALIQAADGFGDRSDLTHRLLSQRAAELERKAEGLRQLADELHWKGVVNALSNLFTLDETKIDLVHAALLISRMDNPELDIDAYRRELDRLAAEVESTLTPSATPRERLAALTRFLFVDNGFHGSRGDYYNRANSYLDAVLDDREGLPITLSILYMELARRLNVPDVVGIPLPGHFVVQYRPDDEKAQWIDVFDGGRLMTDVEAAALVSAYSPDAQAALSLEPATKREIIQRMLRNLVGVALRSNNLTSGLPYLDALVELTPNGGMERWSRAMLRMRVGDSSGARSDLEWLLENRPEGIDPDRIAGLLRSL